MARQVLTYIGHIESDDQILREASCDLLALIGLAQYRLHGHITHAEKAICDLTCRELADTLLLGFTTGRLLMAGDFLRLTANNISHRQDPTRLHISFSHLTMRSNVITNLMINFYEGILENFVFANPSHPDDPANSADPLRSLLAGVRYLNNISADRILKPIEEIGLFHRNTELYKSKLTEIKHLLFGNKAAEEDEIVECTEQLVSILPL